MENNWFKKSHRRCLVDMHIPDWNERFFSQFDSKRYIELMKLAQVDAVYFYTSSCVGLTNYPTKANKMHKGLKGRDVVREITTLAKEEGMHTVVYYNTWSKWAYDHHPEWRVVNAKGQNTAEYFWNQPGRYGVCCYNHEGYREMMLDDLEQLCKNYEFDGLWIDMILLPYTVCYCSACRKRFLEETGRSELPKVVNWNNPDFVQFQQRRQAWQSEYAELVTQSAKKWKPGISVGHNVSSYSAGWQGGPSQKFFDQNDYLSGDISGSPLTVNFTCKMFHSTSRHHSVEFMTTVADANLLEHTVYKPKHFLKSKLYMTMANNGAFSFIDAIDPVGTMNENIYKMMGELYGEAKRYEPFMDFDAEFCQDVAIYTNFESLIDLRDNGKNVENVTNASPHQIAALNAAKAMMDAHIPFGVITKNRLDELHKYQVIILPNMQMVDEEETEAIRNYVRAGGSVYASSYTSLVDKEGKKYENYMLSDVFGVTYDRITWEDIAYYAPTDPGKPLFEEYCSKYPLTVNCRQMIVKLNEGAEALATIVLPDLDPNNPHQFSSAISSPPEIPTSHPGVVLNKYGKGRAIYATGHLETMAKEGQRIIFINLIRSLLSKTPYFQTNAPKPVELTMFRHKANSRYTVNLLNFQQEQPNIPVSGIQVKAKIGDKKIARVVLLPEEQQMEYVVEGETVTFDVPKLETFHMIAIDYE